MVAVGWDLRLDTVGKTCFCPMMSAGSWNHLMALSLTCLMIDAGVSWGRSWDCLPEYQHVASSCGLASSQHGG